MFCSRGIFWGDDRTEGFCDLVLCDGKVFGVEGDPVGGLGKVGRDGGHDHLGVSFGDAEIACSL